MVNAPAHDMGTAKGNPLCFTYSMLFKAATIKYTNMRITLKKAIPKNNKERLLGETPKEMTNSNFVSPAPKNLKRWSTNPIINIEIE